MVADLSSDGIESTIAGATQVTRVAADDTGVYFVGRWDEAPAQQGDPEIAHGYVVKCGFARLFARASAAADVDSDGRAFVVPQADHRVIGDIRNRFVW
jgi:hypothetical protein